MTDNSPTRYCYNSMILELIKEKNLILGLIQENSIEFLVQYIYLLLIVHAWLFLVCPKDYMSARRSTCVVPVA